MIGKNYINGQWVTGTGKVFSSEDPATGTIIWQGAAGGCSDIANAIQAAKNAFREWAILSFDKRVTFLECFIKEIEEKRSLLSETIALETGKPLWEANLEISAVISKLPISIGSYQERCRKVIKQTPVGLSFTYHKPHGVIAVCGPFNFPAHLPNGHIIPALLAGNVIIFKPSELTPLVSEIIMECWQKAELPPGVINLIQGSIETGENLIKDRDIDGVLFTGSFKTGQVLSKYFADFPEKILALEMGGNNPLVVSNISNIKAAVYQVIQSAYVTAGQRCTCARRLIVQKNVDNERFMEKLITSIKAIKISAYTERPEPFMGPVISSQAAKRIIDSYNFLVKSGAKVLVPLELIDKKLPFLRPGLIDVTEVSNRIDEEIFGPLLQLTWVNDFKTAVQEANRTAYGLAASILTDDEALYHQFKTMVRAGIVNWNRATTGASSNAPFGGIGHSGNHRPSAYYAADYCAYPVACLEEKQLVLPKTLSPGIEV